MNRRVLLFPSEIAQDVIQNGIQKANLKLFKIIPLGILAGIFISIGALISTLLRATVPPSQEYWAFLIGTGFFSIGIILVVIAGGELFNGNILMLLSRLDNKITTKQMIRNWILVYFLNFLGVLTIVYISARSGIFTSENAHMFLTIAENKLDLSFPTAFFRGVGCNILVCLSVWICTSAKDTTGKIIASAFPVVTFILIGFEHCIANMFFFTSAFVSGMNVTLTEVLTSNLIPVTIGNIVGGIIVAILYYFSYVYRE